MSQYVAYGSGAAMLTVVGVVLTGHAHPGKTAKSECDTGAAALRPPPLDAGVASAEELEARIKATAGTEAATAMVRLLHPAGKRKEGRDRSENVIKVFPRTPYATSRT